MSPEFLTTREVSDLCGVHVSSIKRWIRLGIIKAFRTAGGHRRIPAREIYAFLRSQGMPVPQRLVNIAKEAFEAGEEVESPKSNVQGRQPSAFGPRPESALDADNPVARDPENQPAAHARHSTPDTLHSATKVLVLGDGEELAAYVAEEGLSDRVFIERAMGFVDAGAKIARFRPDVVLVRGNGPGRTAEDLRAEIEKAGLADGVKIFEFRDRSSVLRILRSMV